MPEVISRAVLRVQQHWPRKMAICQGLCVYWYETQGRNTMPAQGTMRKSWDYYCTYNCTPSTMKHAETENIISIVVKDYLYS